MCVLYIFSYLLKITSVLKYFIFPQCLNTSETFSLVKDTMLEEIIFFLHCLSCCHLDAGLTVTKDM